MIKKIHQIAFSKQDLTGYVPPNKNNLEGFMPDGEYKLWNFTEAIRLLEEDNATEVLQAIKKINAGALQSDIFRLYIIKKFGGWYVDLNNYIQVSSQDPHIQNKELIIFGETQLTAIAPWGIQNGLFYAEPNHPAIQKALAFAVENVNNMYYGFSPSCPTGPNVLGAAVASHNLPEDHRQVYGEFIWHVTNRRRGFYYRGSTEPFALYKPTMLEPGVNNLPGGNNYVEMWHRRELYSEY